MTSFASHDPSFQMISLVEKRPYGTLRIKVCLDRRLEGDFHDFLGKRQHHDVTNRVTLLKQCNL